MRALVVGLALAATACGQSTAPPAAEAEGAALTSTLFSYGGGYAPVLTGSVMTGEYTPPPTWFICDSIDGPDAFVAGIPDEGGAFMLARYHKDTQTTEVMNVIRSGELFAAPNGPAQAFNEGDTLGVIYTLDAARMSSPDAATTTPVIGLDFAGEEFNCRWFEHMVFLGFTSTQSVVVRRRGDAIDMMTFAHNAEGALMVEMEHGEQSTIVDISARDGNQGTGYNRDDVVQWGFTTASDGHAYSVWTAEGEPSALQALTNGEVTSTEEFLAYTLARP